MSSPKSATPNDAPWAAAVEGQRVTATYSNAFRASGSGEELILDFGLDPHRHIGDDSEPTVLLQRLVLNWSHAKRLAVMLRDLVQLHEKNHGPISLDTHNRPANPPSPPT